MQPLNTMVIMILTDYYWISQIIGNFAISEVILSRNPRQNVEEYCNREIICYNFCHRVRKLAVMDTSKMGPVMSIVHGESKEPGRILSYLLNKLLCLRKVLPLSDLCILFFMVLTTTNNNNSDTVLK